MNWISYIFVIVALAFGCQTILGIEMVYDHLEMMNETYYEGFYNISECRVAKFNRTMYTYNVEFEIFRDLDETMDVEMNFYYNRLNNNQYSRSTMRIRKDGLCNIMNRFYQYLITPSNQNHTNLPGPGTKFCPLKKVNYCKHF